MDSRRDMRQEQQVAAKEMDKASFTASHPNLQILREPLLGPTVRPKMTNEMPPFLHLILFGNNIAKTLHPLEHRPWLINIVHSSGTAQLLDAKQVAITSVLSAF